MQKTAQFLNKALLLNIFLFSFGISQPVFEFEIIPIPEMGTPIQLKSDGSALVGESTAGEAIYWSDSTGVVSMGSGEIWGISDNDRLFGEMVNAQGILETVLIENGEIAFLGNVEGGGSCDAFYSHGLDISEDGLTGVGMGWINCGTEAFYWTDEDGIVELGQYEGNSTKAMAVSGDGQRIGGWAQTNNRNSVLWDREGNITFLGSFQNGNNYGEVSDISRDGTKVVGYCAGSGNNSVEGYIWTDENGLAALGVPTNSANINSSIAFAVSDNCVVVGQYLNQSPIFYQACIYTPELTMFTNLRDYLLTLGMEEITDWDLTRALCVSNDGNTIAGYGKDPDGNWTSWILRITVGEAPGERLLVPSEYATIQDAINVADDRDTVLVSPGTYPETIDFSGKNIVVTSYGLVYGSPENFMHQTIIDAGGNGSVVTLDSGEDSSAVLYGFTLQNGVAEFGGGVFIESSEPTLEYLYITNNEANYGGGLYARYEGRPVMNHVTIIENSAGQGGGLRFRDDADPIISNCLVKWNQSTGEGGGIYCNNADPTILFSTLVGNVAEEGGDALYLRINSEASILNTTVVINGSNSSESSSGIYCLTNSSVNMTNSILWGNHGYEVEFSESSNQNFAEISYCNVNGGVSAIQTNGNGTINWSDGNMDEDPLFCDSWNWDFSLAEDSPCVEAGLNGENIGAHDVGCGPALRVERSQNEVKPRLNYFPNPFNATLSIKYDVLDEKHIQIQIFDLSGRLIHEIENKIHSPGSYTTQWYGTNEQGEPVSSGVYLLVMDVYNSKSNHGNLVTDKIILIK